MASVGGKSDAVAGGGGGGGVGMTGQVAMEEACRHFVASEHHPPPSFGGPCSGSAEPYEQAHVISRSSFLDRSLVMVNQKSTDWWNSSS